MMGKIKKLLILFKKRKEAKSLMLTLLNRDKLTAILKKHNMYSIPEVDMSDLFLQYPNYDFKGILKLKTDFSKGRSPLNDYYLLCQLAKAINTENYFEIGTWIGLSAANIASNLPPSSNIYTLDIPYDHPELKIFNIPEDHFGYYSKGFPNVNHLKSDSKYFDFSYYKGKIDLVFVDGNHSFDYVLCDSKNAYSLIRDEHSIIAWHDYLLEGEINLSVLCGILEAIPSELHKHLIHIPQSNMVLYSRSFSFPDKPAEKWQIPELQFEVNIRSSHNKRS